MIDLLFNDKSLLNCGWHLTHKPNFNFVKMQYPQDIEFSVEISQTPRWNGSSVESFRALNDFATINGKYCKIKSSDMINTYYLAKLVSIENFTAEHFATCVLRFERKPYLFFDGEVIAVDTTGIQLNNPTNETARPRIVANGACKVEVGDVTLNFSNTSKNVVDGVLIEVTGANDFETFPELKTGVTNVKKIEGNGTVELEPRWRLQQ